LNPILDRDHREVGAPRLTGGRIQVRGPGAAKARTEVVDADDEPALGVDGLAGADEVVPPAFAFGNGGAVGVGVAAGHVVAGVEGVTHQHGVGARGVELAIAFIDQIEGGQHGAAAQRQRLTEVQRLRGGDHGL